MVDGLGEIVEVAEDRVRFLPSMVAAEDTFADAALTADGVRAMAIWWWCCALTNSMRVASSAPANATAKMAAA